MASGSIFKTSVTVFLIALKYIYVIGRLGAPYRVKLGLENAARGLRAFFPWLDLSSDWSAMVYKPTRKRIPPLDSLVQ